MLSRWSVLELGDKRGLLDLGRTVFLLCCMLSVFACSPVPQDHRLSDKGAGAEFLPSSFIIARDALPPTPHPTRIQPLNTGEEALGARLQLIDDAQKTLDVSAFIIRPDHAGYLFVQRVLQAADRGVHVRLLLDDLFNYRTAGKFVALNEHPNIEVRIFNPVSRYSPLVVDFIVDYDRVSRRMHSRMMVVDGQSAMIGGRNIADEYYSDDGYSEFLDFEMVVKGKIAQDFSAAFESYWTDTWSMPLAELSSRDYQSLYAHLQSEIPERTKLALARKYPNLASLALYQPESPVFRGSAGLVTDSLDKLRGINGQTHLQVAEHHFQNLIGAQKSVLIITPYFIPEERGAQMLTALAARGVAVTVVTNSLASTNHVAVHGGYAPYRKRLLRAGVELHELRPRSEAGAHIRQTLHTKLTVVDGVRTIISTMNFDPVSIRGNAETSVVVSDQAFAMWVKKQVNPAALGKTFQLELSEENRIVWRHPSGITPAPERTEPRAESLRRFLSDMSRFLRLESML